MNIIEIRNTQPAEKQRTESPLLEVHSVFYTIQGEGPFAGQPAVFVRLAGCNLQCPGCDTEYTSNRRTLYPHEVLTLVAMHMEPRKAPRKVCDMANWPLVVITGGEPFRQQIGQLVRLLVSKMYRVQIETNGTLFAEGLPWDSITVVCSPKTGKINPKLLPHVDAFKYVLHHESVDPDDGLPTLALGHSASPRVARPPEGNVKPVYLQPMDTSSADSEGPSSALTDDMNLQACIASCMRFGYTLQLQIHKLINLE